MTMYVYQNGNHYFWGSYMKSRPNGIVSDWVFRSTPMQPGRWYISRNMAVMVSNRYLSIATKENDGWVLRHRRLIQPTKYSGKVYATMVISPRGQVTQGKHKQDTIGNVNCLSNRLKEYVGSYLIPFSIGNRTIKERWCA